MIASSGAYSRVIWLDLKNIIVELHFKIPRTFVPSVPNFSVGLRKENYGRWLEYVLLSGSW